MQHIPIIAVDALATGRAAQSAIDAACREWGFFQIVDHGLDAALIEALRREMTAFFAQPGVDKRAISRTADNPWGYFDQELTKNTPDWKEIFDFGPEGSTPEMPALRPQWPPKLERFEGVLRAYYAECEAIARTLIRVIAANLGAPPDILDHAFEPDHTSFLRLNYYPPCPAPEAPEGVRVPKTGHLGINHHTDAGAVTVLLQDGPPGLQVYRDDEWHTVELVPGALVINIGDIVQVWSNDRYRAALHRVLANADAKRYSAALFFNPSYSTHYAPLPSTVDEAHPARYRPIPWAEFRAGRAAGDFADYGAEIQIDDYRIAPTERGTRP